jgi:hypothetical protein
MSKGHQASRRRTYGRRQHEMHERREPGRQDLEVDRDLGEDGFARRDARAAEYRTQPYGATWIGLE